MSNEGHQGGSDGGGADSKPDQSASSPGARLADRYGITNIGFELKESGELAMRLGTVAHAYRGDHLAATLLLIRERLMALPANIYATCDYLQEQARIALNAGHSDPRP